MPFNSSGLFERLYSWVADRNNGLKIRADRMDAEFDNFKSGMNDIVLGNAAMKGPVKAVFGSALNPAYTFADDPDSGLFHKPDGSIGVSVGGVEVGAFPASFFTGISDHLSATDDPHTIAPSTILTKLKTVDGAGSGLDADLLDGQHGAFYQNADNLNVGEIPDGRLPERLRAYAPHLTDWNDAVQNGWFSGHNAANAPGTGWFLGDVVAHMPGWVTQTVHAFSSDGEADTKTYRRGRNNGIWGAWYRLRLSETEQSAIYRNASNLNAGIVPSARLSGTYNIEISGSAANADKLDGLQASHFLPVASYSATDVFAKVKSLDGAGSGLDADLLDGQHGAFYQNADNLNVGEIPDGRLPERLRAYAPHLTDWNDAVQNGWFSGHNAANAPGTGWFLGDVVAHMPGWVTQTVHAFTDDAAHDTKTYRRERNNGVWGSWYRLRLSQTEQSAIYRNASNLSAGTVPLPRLAHHGAAGAVGTFALARQVDGVQRGFGDVVPGSVLKPSNCVSMDNGASVLAGSWRCLGVVSGGSDRYFGAVTTLWLRIA